MMLLLFFSLKRWVRVLHSLTGGGRYVFPCTRSRRRPMSENAILGALRRLGLPARVRRCLTSAEASSAVCIILIRTANDLCPPATRRAEALRCRRELKTADNEARC